MFKSSLKKRRIKLLPHGEKLIGDTEEIKSAKLANMYDNLKLFLNEPINRIYGYNFTTSTELAEIISKLDFRAHVQQDKDWRSSLQQGDIFM